MSLSRTISTSNSTFSFIHSKYSVPVLSFLFGVVSTALWCRHRRFSSTLFPFSFPHFSRNRRPEFFSLSQRKKPNMEESMFTIFTWNDMYELDHNSEGVGGLAEVMTLLEEERAKTNNSHLTTVVGDFISVTSLANLYKGSHMIQLLNDMKVDLVVPGNHEFDYGPAELDKRVRESKFSWLGTNIRDKNGNNFSSMKDYHVIQFNDFKIGFFGICTDETKILSFPADTLFLDPVETAKSAIKNLKEQGVNYIIALTHQWYAQDLDLSKKVPDIDLILGGHDHSPITAYQGKTLIHKSGQNAEFIGRLDLLFQRNISTKEVNVIPSWKMIANSGYSRHPVIAKGIDKLMEKYEILKKNILGKTETLLDSKTQTVRSQEATMGNIVADSVREYLGTELAIIQGGAIRGNIEYPAGTILTEYDIIREFPFANMVRSMTLQGKFVKAALEQGIRYLPASAGCFPQISGMKIVVDLKQPVGERIIDITVNGKPLDPEREYSITTTTFISIGGDGYFALQNGTLTNHPGNDATLLSDIISNYIKKHQPITPSIEGRIVVKS